jgi:hypothetical protein
MSDGLVYCKRRLDRRWSRHVGSFTRLSTATGVGILEPLVRCRRDVRCDFDSRHSTGAGDRVAVVALVRRAQLGNVHPRRSRLLP